MESEGEIITPDRFIPLIAQFNLSHRFDMCVLEKLLLWLRDHPASQGGTRFSVNLMPLTLMQKRWLPRLARCSNTMVSRRRTLSEITEEQAFSNSGSSIKTFSSYGIVGSVSRLMILVPAMPTTNDSDAFRRISLK